MKLAIVHDYLTQIGGSEKVFQYICETFPDADIYCFGFNQKKTLKFFKNKKIIVPIYARHIKNRFLYNLSFPFLVLLSKFSNFEKYDFVISSSASISKYINVKKPYHICYCYQPTKAIWEFEDFFKNKIFKLIFKLFFLKWLRNTELKACGRINQFITISDYCKKEVKEIYQKDSYVIHPPIDLKEFDYSNSKEDYFLLVSRLEPWKKNEIVIDAFNELNKKLIIVGTGSEEQYLREKSNKNIFFKGFLSQNDLALYYSKAKAVIMPTYLNYGLTLIEACASGTPVICLNSPGPKELMIDARDKKINDFYTGLFFDNLDKKSIIEAIEKFDNYHFQYSKIYEYSKNWDKKEFIKKFKKILY